MSLDEARRQVRAALLARSQARLDAVLVEAGHHLGPATALALTRDEVDRLPPDVLAWWQEPCDLCAQPAPGHTHN
jgi:hypothetical protein